MTNFKCNICHRQFKRKQDLNRHMSCTKGCANGSKTNKKIQSFNCRYCKKSFNRKDNMQRHLKTCKLNTTNINVNNSKNFAINNGKNGVAVNNSPISINLIVFTKDGVDNLSYGELNEILGSNENLVQALIKTVNLNPDKPEHHNIYYSDLKSTYGEVYENKTWVKRKIDEILNTLIDAKL
ncbi:zf-C2H2-N-terminal protein [Tupanvirus soda lake]|uniref:Zf-C2H2-N-terminal protein n=2 Tax=Tupanvirus TaxID=2094720 RepID=A0A6N1NW91_9VIRU|nr:zf-C2H2-N-terminal protein [Tupanvirus soda lake]QKU35646.1 zf-C2H2-N-terminal protein [Tupanvirus soda lake]